MPAIVGGLISAGGSILGGVFGGDAQSKAAKEQAAALQQAVDFQHNVYNTEQTNLNPYIGTGTNALYSLASLYGLPGAPGGAGGAGGAQNGAAQAFQNFTQLPSYTFPYQQGLLAANRGLAAAGLTGSGAAAKGLTQYGQGYASQGFQGYISQLAGLAGLGQTSAVQLGSSGNQAGSNLLQGYGGIGAAQAGGTLGQANSLTSGISGALGALGNNSMGTSSFGSSSPLGSIMSLFGGAPAPQGAAP